MVICPFPHFKAYFVPASHVEMGTSNNLPTVLEGLIFAFSLHDREASAVCSTNVPDQLCQRRSYPPPFSSLLHCFSYLEVQGLPEVAESLRRG